MKKKDIHIKGNGFLRKITDSGVLPKRAAVFALRALIALAFFFNTVFAQAPAEQVKTSLDRDHVLIGEPVVLNIEINTGMNHPVTEWIVLPDRFNRLEVLGRSPRDSSYAADRITYRQSFTLTGFEPGTWMIPAMSFVIDKKTRHTDSLPVTIIAAILKDSAYHDIREIIEVPPSKTSWWYYLAGILSLIALGLLVVLWIRQRSGSVGVERDHGRSVSPLKEALEQLSSPATGQLIRDEEWKGYYSRVTDIFKTYIEKKFAFPAMQKTTDELLVFLHGLGIKNEYPVIAEVLRMADAVKFAKYKPEREVPGNARQAMVAGLKALDQINISIAQELF